MKKFKKSLIFIFVMAFLITSIFSSISALADEKDIERVDIIHYTKPHHENRGNAEGKSIACYKLLGVKWNTLPVNYAINPTNSQGLTEMFVTSAISTSAETWDSSTVSELFNNQYSVDYDAVYGVRDYENALVFGDYPNNGVIAITTYWYNRRTKEIVEFDVLFNTRFEWGDATIDPLKMDLQNIATHEIGHGIGLNDIYNSVCSEVTMYGYSTEGETKKRTLEQPDIFGLQKMYL